MIRRERDQLILELERELARSSLSSGDDGRALCLRHAERVIALLARSWSSERFELACAGSYGRGVPAPFSDLDLVFIGDDDLEEAARAALYPLWDAGFSVGHQVLERGAPLGEDLAAWTTRLDLRHVAGARATVDAPISPLALAAKLREDADARKERFGGSPFLLEPEVKLGAGGLRDIDAIRWVLRASGRELGAQGARALDEAEELLLRVRNRLHLRAGRRSDRLTFDAQEEIARAMGYGDDPHVAAERLMQDYYRAARAVAILRARVLAPPVTRGPDLDLGRGLILAAGHLGLREGALEDDPAAALRLFAEHARGGRAILPAAEDAIARACGDEAFCERLRASRAAASAFVELVSSASEVLARLHDVGLLVAMIPELVPVTGRVHHDVYHVLTVDAHSVSAVLWLGALVRGELASPPVAAQLAPFARSRVLLLLAALLHDVGKGYPDASGLRQDHSLRGAEICDRVLPRLGFDPEETARARALVLHHLTMYRFASRRDLDDPAVIAELAAITRTREGLRDLYLLTLADIATTAPGALTAWKARMLEQLYARADAALAGEAAEEGELKARVLEAASPRERDAVRKFLRGMDARYLAAHPPASIALHARIVTRRRGPCTIELVREDPDVCELCVVAFDAPGLLARIAAALSANALEVLGARAHSLARAGTVEALDVFFVRPRGGRDPKTCVAGARRDLARLMRGEVGEDELLDQGGSPWRERPKPAIPTRVRVQPGIVEVVTKDRPGLLYALSRALHELELVITLAKVTTEGSKAIDVFYVTERDGRPLESSERLAHIRVTLQRALSDENDQGGALRED